MTMQLVALALALLASGAIVGLLAGVFGSAAGRWSCPFSMGFFSGSACPGGSAHAALRRHLARAHHSDIACFLHDPSKESAIDLALLKSWMAPIVVGVVGGAVAARYAPASLFKIVFVSVTLATAARLLLGNRLPQFGREVPQRFVAPYGVIIGASASLIGIWEGSCRTSS